MATVSESAAGALPLRNADRKRFVVAKETATRLAITAFPVVTVVALLALVSPLSAITITEILYRPRASDEAALGQGRSLEWIEIYNEDPTVIHLSGYRFDEGIDFVFPPDTYLEGRSYLVLCADEQAVRAHYGIRNTIGNYSGRLGNDGENIALAIFGGGPEVEVEYDDRGDWPHAADGTGHSLVLIEPFLDPSDPKNWRASPQIGGSPGGPNFDEPTVDQDVVLPDNAVWRYLPGTAPYPANWRDVGFNDASWQTGQTGIGYGDGDDRTELTGMAGNYISFAARRVESFTQAEIDAFGELFLEISYDDSFVLWVNGTEIARGGDLPGNPGQNVAHDTPGGLHEAGAFEPYPFSKNLLRVGQNVFACQIHNNTVGSSDVSFIPRIVSSRVIVPAAGLEAVTVAVNEVQFRDGNDVWIELANTSAAALDLSLFQISSSETAFDAFTLGAGTTIPPRGRLLIDALAAGLSLTPAAFEVFVWRPERTAVVVAEAFAIDPLTAPSLAGTSEARFPDIDGPFLTSLTPTPGAANEVPLEDAVVIHEIFYHPPRGQEAIEFIELYNRGNVAVDIGGFELRRAVRYRFPIGTSIAPGGFLVVAKDPQALESAHGSGGVLGPWEGELADGGETIRLVDLLGNPIDEVPYLDGGAWPDLADGGGSSLELLDPFADNSVASAWAASDETMKSSWEEISFSISYPRQTESEFQIRMLDGGECLLDEIRCVRSGTNYVVNGGFETNTAPWRIEGNHIRSHRTTMDAFVGNASLRVVSTGSGDLRVNQVEQDTSPFMEAGTYTVSLAARWIAGSNALFLSCFRQPTQFQKVFQLPIPSGLGTPGAPNSSAVANLGPTISDVRHTPTVPRANQSVRVQARVSDPDGVSAVRVRYRLGSRLGNYSTATLFDDGLHADGLAGDGLFAGTVPGQASDARVVFYVEADDVPGAQRRFPVDAPDRAPVYEHASPLTARAHTARLVHDDSAWTELRSRYLHSDELLDATFVFNDEIAYYNVGTRYRGSPWNRPPDPKMYRVKFPADDSFRGRSTVNISRYGSAQTDRASNYAVWRNSTASTPSPMSRGAFARFRDRNQTSSMEIVDPVNKDYVGLWFPDDDDGTLLKIQGKLVFNDAGNHNGDVEWASYEYRGTDEGNYRWTFSPRTRESEDDFTPLVTWLQKLSGSTTVLDREIERWMDVEQFFRVYTVRCAQADWDTIAIGNGQNMYVYWAPIEARWKLIPWDMDHTWEPGRINDRLFPDADGRMGTLVNRPKFRRIYLGILNEMVNERDGETGYWNTTEMVDKFLDRNTAAVGSDGVAGAGGIRTFINGRRSRIAALIPAVLPFEITTNSGEPLTVDTATALIQGNGWVDVHHISVDGELVELTWSAVTRWQATVPVDVGLQTLVFVAQNSDGSVVGIDEIDVTSTFGWAPPVVSGVDPTGASPGAEVTVSGSEFHDGIRVLFSGKPSPRVVFDGASDPGTLRAEVPLVAEGRVDLLVENVDGRSSEPFPFDVGPTPPQFVRGDANLDGVVDLSDPIRTLRHLFSGASLRCTDAGDFDDDEDLDLTDAVGTLNFLFREGIAPRAPFPGQGYDPTGVGPLDCVEGLTPEF
jgi:hypothetical protein